VSSYRYTGILQASSQVPAGKPSGPAARDSTVTSSSVDMRLLYACCMSRKQGLTNVHVFSSPSALFVGCAA